MNVATIDIDPSPSIPVADTGHQPLRVTHLVSTLNIGGLEKVVYDLTRLADPARVHVQVVCLGEVGALAEQFADVNVPVRSLGVLGLGTRRAVAVLARELRNDLPDVLHTHNPAPHLVGALAARWAKVPAVVHTKHGRNYPNDPRKVWTNRLATWFTDRVVPVSDDSADVALAIEKVSGKKVRRIWNGIDLERFPHHLTEVHRSPLQAIHVARLIYPAKDQKTLLRAVRLVADEEPRFHIDLVGDGPHRADIESLCDELRLSENVRFLGFRHDVHELLTESGLFILSSVNEGLSITLLEAMANGLPIVATRVGGNAEVVTQGKTGLLVPARSPRDMADAILTLVRDPALAAKYGEAGRARVEEHFDLRKVVKQYEVLYCELLAARGWTP